MSSKDQLGNTTSEADSSATIARFSITEPDVLGRMTVYVREASHLVEGSHKMMFVNDSFTGLSARSGIAGTILLDIAYRFQYYAVDTYDPYIGLCVYNDEMPNRAGLALKLDFYKKENSSVQDICLEIAEAIHGKPVDAEIRHLR